MIVDDAIAYVSNKVMAIRALPNDLVRQRQALAAIRDVATEAGQLTNAQAAQTRLDEAYNDLQSAVLMNNRLDSVLDTYAEVKQAIGLGILPIVPIAAGVLLVTIASVAVYLFGRASTREASIATLVDALKAGGLTPAQLQRLLEILNGGGGGGTGGLLDDAKNLLLLGIGAVVVMTVLKYAPTRGTA